LDRTSDQAVVRLEVGHFPLVLLDLGGSERTPDEFREAFAQFHDVNRRARAEGKRWILVAVTESPPNAIERKIIAEESNKFSPDDQKLCAASVLVIPNGIIRSVVTALGWMIHTMSPLVPAPTTAAAVDVAVERLRTLGIDCSAEEAGHARRWFQQNESMTNLRASAGGKKAAR
jgi:hypothetical protein